jgi:hypothetical protein
VAYLDSSPSLHGSEYRGIIVRPPAWAPDGADVVLCSSFAHELTQLEILDTIPVKSVLSHPPLPRPTLEARLAGPQGTSPRP